LIDKSLLSWFFFIFLSYSLIIKDYLSNHIISYCLSLSNNILAWVAGIFVAK
jgi:hypothetical protein